MHSSLRHNPSRAPSFGVGTGTWSNTTAAGSLVFLEDLETRTIFVSLAQATLSGWEKVSANLRRSRIRIETNSVPVAGDGFGHPRRPLGTPMTHPSQGHPSKWWA